MKKLSILIASFLLFSQAQADQATKAQNLIAAVKEHCEMPNKMAPYTAANFERYVLQAVDPEFKMLSTAFLQGFSAYDSGNLKRGYCVITFLGQPNHPEWERGFDFHAKAKSYGNLPTAMFAGFNEADEVLLQPVTDVN